MAARDEQDEHSDDEQPSPLDHHRGGRDEPVTFRRREHDQDETPPADGGCATTA